MLTARSGRQGPSPATPAATSSVMANPTFRRWMRKEWRGCTCPSAMYFGHPSEPTRTSLPSSMLQMWTPSPIRCCVRARLADLGQEILPRNQRTSQALGALHRAEIEERWPIIKAPGIKAERPKRATNRLVSATPTGGRSCFVVTRSNKRTTLY